MLLYFMNCFPLRDDKAMRLSARQLQCRGLPVVIPVLIAISLFLLGCSGDSVDVENYGADSREDLLKRFIGVVQKRDEEGWKNLYHPDCLQAMEDHPYTNQLGSIPNPWSCGHAHNPRFYRDFRGFGGLCCLRIQFCRHVRG